MSFAKVTQTISNTRHTTSAIVNIGIDHLANYYRCMCLLRGDKNKKKIVYFHLFRVVMWWLLVFVLVLVPVSITNYNQFARMPQSSAGVRQ